MLVLKIQEQEFFDNVTQEFFILPEITYKLEHSLAAISRWESLHHKAFLKADSKTKAETDSYIQCMLINQDDIIDFNRITDKEIKIVNDYINNKYTATYIGNTTKPNKKQKAKDVMTVELIRYYMLSFKIPVEYEKEHIDSLLTLIELCNSKNAPKKKQSIRDIHKQHNDIEAANRARFGIKD